MLPQMRAFVRFLTGDPVVADDLIQEAIVRALRAYRTFAMGSNLKAWMFTIIRNTRINGLRKPRPEHLDDVMIEGLRCPQIKMTVLTCKTCSRPSTGSLNRSET